MKKIILGVITLLSLGLISCEQGSSVKYQAINRQKAILLIDQESGEVFMMDLVIEKGKGVVGSEWKNMGDPSMAK